MADPARLRILALLADASRCVCDINRKLVLPANLLSYHLRVLHQAGMVERSRRGRWIDYRLAHDAAGQIAAALEVAGLKAVVAQNGADEEDERESR